MRALLWSPLPTGDVQCRLCAHACHIKNGHLGLCRVRANRDGQLIPLVGNVISSVQMDPVEKKPLYHFLPGTRTFSVGSAGCNFRCTFCQNHQISRIAPSGMIPGKRVQPESLLELAKKNGARSMAFTYNEPTVFFELVYSCAGMAQAAGLKVILVTNGYMSSEFLQIMRHRVSAANVDLKSFRDEFYQQYCGARLKPVLRNLITMKKMGWWLEVTTLVIPGHNDSKEELTDIARFIHDELGADTVWHVTAFRRAYKMTSVPDTSLDKLEEAWGIGREAGLEYVYIGNVASGLWRPRHRAARRAYQSCGQSRYLPPLRHTTGRSVEVILVYTGNGKGKTSASVGQTIRALGQNMRVAFGQFMKRDGQAGEQVMLARLLGEHFLAGGAGFLRHEADKPAHREAALRVLDWAKAQLATDLHMLVLDESLYALDAGILSRQEVEELVAEARARSCHLVLSGRHAPPWLLEIADLVTDMGEVKHPWQQGIKATAGIEF